MVVFTCVITIANILLWLSKRCTIALQVKSNYSLNHQSLITGHRDLFLGMMRKISVLTANRIWKELEHSLDIEVQLIR